MAEGGGSISVSANLGAYHGRGDASSETVKFTTNTRKLIMADDWGTIPEGEPNFEFDADGFSSEDLGGGSVDKEGYYHFDISDVKNELETLSNKGNERSPCVAFTMTVLESVAGQSPAGSKHWHRVYMAAKGGAPASEGAIKNALRFGMGLGLLKEVEKDGRKCIVDAATGSTKITPATWANAKGKQCVAKVVHKAAEGGFPEGYEIPFSRVYQVDDPAVKDVPKNRDALALIGKTSAAAGAPPQQQQASGNSAKKPAATQPPKQTAAPLPPTQASVPADDMDLSGL